MNDLYAQQLEMQLRFAEEEAQKREMFAYEQGRADARKKVLEEIKRKAQDLICPEYDERYEFFNDGVQLVIDIIEDCEREINLT